MSKVSKNALSYEEVSSYIEDKGCFLLSKEYVRAKGKLNIECSCGDMFVTTFNDFKFGGKVACNDCSKKALKLRNVAKLTRYAREYIYDKGCELISKEVPSARSKIKIKCPCGDVYAVDFNKFKSSDQIRCMKCNGKTKWTQSKVVSFIEENSNCKMITSKYVGARENLELQCFCGEIFSTTFRSFLFDNKRRCDKCVAIAIGEKNKAGLLLMEMRVVELSDSRLLIKGDYGTYADTFEFMCSCGNVFETTFQSFLFSKRACNLCTGNSKMEKLTESILKEKGVNFKSEYSFEDLRGVNDGKLRFDFAFLDDNDELLVLLELDGEFHYEEGRFANATEKFETQKEHDKRKNLYCAENEIDLIRVPYYEKDNIPEVLNGILNNYVNLVPSLS